MDMLLLFLPAIAFAGIVTSWEDLRGRGIRNVWVAFSLAYALAVMLAAAGYALLSGSGFSVSYICDYAVNILLSASAGYLLWHAGIWSAGDGKLLAAYAALLPLSVYSYGYVRLFPSLAILVNAFIVVVPALAAAALWKGRRTLSLKKVFAWRLLARAFASMLGLSWLIRSLLSLAGIPYDLLAFVIVVPAVYLLIEKAAKADIRLFYAAAFALAVIFDSASLLSYSLYYVLYVLVFAVLRYALFSASYEAFSRHVSIGSLRPGMMPAETIYEKGGNYVKQGGEEEEAAEPGRKRLGKPLFGKRLKQEDVEALRRLLASGKIGPELRVHSTMPFAVFLFAGVILTIAFSGSAVAFIAGILR